MRISRVLYIKDNEPYSRVHLPPQVHRPLLISSSFILCRMLYGRPFVNYIWIVRSWLAGEYNHRVGLFIVVEKLQQSWPLTQSADMCDSLRSTAAARVVLRRIRLIDWWASRTRTLMDVFSLAYSFHAKWLEVFGGAKRKRHFAMAADRM